MIISEEAVAVLVKYSKHELAKSVHPEDAQIYTRGLQDGCAILADIILGYLQTEPTGEKADA